jgi:hypothetical protein
VCAASAFSTSPPLGARHAGEVEVVQVHYETVRGPGGRWYAINVELEAKPSAGNPTRFVDRVKVGLNLGVECSSGASRRFEFYRAEASAVAVEHGRATFRFYLPPEIVERDRLSGEARYHFVELSVAGHVVPTGRKHVSASLPTAGALARFRSRIAAEAPANDGVLLPQPATPFAVALGGPSAPTFLLPP